MLEMLRVFTLMLLMAGGEPVLLGAGVLQDEPAVASMTPAAPEDVHAAREFYRQVQAATGGGSGVPRTVTLSAETLQSVLRLGARIVPGYRAATEVSDDLVRITGAVPVPWYDGARWLNLHAEIAPFQDRFVLHHVRVGEREISPELALRLARLAGTLVLGAGEGDKVFAAPAAMAIDGDRILLSLRLDREGRTGVIKGVFGALRGGGLPPPERVDHYYVKLRTAMDRLEAPVRGSFLPLLRLAILMAYEQADDQTGTDEFTAAILALAKACGAVDFRMIVGPAAGEASGALGRWRTGCDRLVLAGRIDLRRHFVTAAAVKAASNRGFAISLGEFKELYDSLSGAGGFDFTDIVANNSGIRLANLFLSRPHAEWPELLERMQTERDVLADLDDIPGVMPREQFQTRFGDIDSPAYRAMIDLIEARIDRTALHAPTPVHGG
jgi:hypothetical protein